MNLPRTLLTTGADQRYVPTSLPHLGHSQPTNVSATTELA
jgi:hypothetical protein